MAKDHLNVYNETHTAIIEDHSRPEEVQQGSLLTINGTLPFIAVSFVIFTIIMQKVLYGPISNIRKKRAEYVKGIKSEAVQAQEETEKLKKDYNDKITATRQKVSKKTTEVMNEANEEKSKILQEKRQDVQKFLEEGRSRINGEKQRTFDSLKENISSYAYEISKKILNEEVPMVGVSQEVIDKAINR